MASKYCLQNLSCFIGWHASWVTSATDHFITALYSHCCEFFFCISGFAVVMSWVMPFHIRSRPVLYHIDYL